MAAGDRQTIASQGNGNGSNNGHISEDAKRATTRTHPATAYGTAETPRSYRIGDIGEFVQRA
jgi:hypothetical protein